MGFNSAFKGLVLQNVKFAASRLVVWYAVGSPYYGTIASNFTVIRELLSSEWF
jgi:hypothetical protein